MAELLGRAFRARQVRPGDGVVAYLSRRIERSAAAAAAVVARLNDAALAAGRPVNRAFASELLGDQPDLFSGDGESDGTAST